MTFASAAPSTQCKHAAIAHSWGLGEIPCQVNPRISPKSGMVLASGASKTPPDGGMKFVFL